MKIIFRRIADYIRECDKSLYILCIITTLFGSVAVLSATYYTSGGSLKEFLMQIFCLGLGLVAVIIISNFNYKSFCRFWPLYLTIGLGLVVLTFFIGFAPGNTDDKAWLRIPGGFTFQPSELLKICFIISFGYHCYRIGDKVKSFLHTLLLCVHGAIPILLVHFQGDDGSALIFAFMFIGMMFAAGVKLRYFIIAISAALVSTPFLYMFVMNDDQRSRINSMFFGTESDYLGPLYQQYRGRVALANGGWFGQGIFKGPLVQSSSIPYGHNDFIITGIGEEFGLIGVFVVFILLILICFRILKIGFMSNSKLGLVMCVGMFSLLFSQSLINIGMCLWLLPVIGVALPFFSAGGSSLLCTYLGIAVIMSVYIHRDSGISYIHDDKKINF
jgi:rod shape determining protein RodA